MPNWVHNIVIFYDKKMAERYISVKENEEDSFDFNLVIQMPPELRVESGAESDAIIYYLSDRMTKPYFEVQDQIESALRYQSVVGLYGYSMTYDRLKNQVKNESTRKFYDDVMYYRGLTYVTNIIKYGYPTWYQWCMHKWGVKWNASSCIVHRYANKCIVSFDTPWNIPVYVYEKICADNPMSMITVIAQFEGGDTVKYKNINGEFKMVFETPFDYEDDEEGKL